MAPSERLRSRQPILRLLRRALGNRCPLCGEDRVFEGLFRMRHHCHACTFVYIREPGYFLGAIYLNYGLTCVLALVIFHIVAARVELSVGAHLLYLGPFTVLFPTLFFRYSRLLWMVMDLTFSAPEERDFLPPPEEALNAMEEHSPGL